MLRIALLLIFCLSPGMLFAEENPTAADDDWYMEARELYFGVPVQLRFQGGDQALAERVWAYLESIDDVFNDYREDSEVSALNRAPTGWLQVSPAMAEAIRLAFQVHVLSDGAFDISVGPLRRLWKDAAGSGELPSQAAIADARAQVGLEHIVLQGEFLCKRQAAVSLDFGGLIKGLAVDHAMAMLIEAGIENGMVQVGGETAAIGLNPRGTRHAFAIPDPKDPARYLQVVEDPGQGYSGCTSGNYHLPIIIGGRPFYHIFDPRSGRPCDVHVLSVSVVFPQIGRNGLADALSTSGVVLGPERLIPLVESLGGDCLVLTENAEGTVIEHRSQGWETYLRNR